MAKVFPQRSILSPFMSLKRETFTIWMKSLVCHSNGCTVFDSSGDIVYRVDNYDKRCSNEAYLMDVRGKVVVAIRRKGLQIFGRWYGYRSPASINDEKPWFQVKRCFRICMGNSVCQVNVGIDKYWVEKVARKVAFRIVGIDGYVLAEVRRKRLSSGITLGDDVLTLIVEPHIDHSLVMAILVIYGLINQQL